MFDLQLFQLFQLLDTFSGGGHQQIYIKFETNPKLIMVNFLLVQFSCS